MSYCALLCNRDFQTRFLDVRLRTVDKGAAVGNRLNQKSEGRIRFESEFGLNLQFTSTSRKSIRKFDRIDILEAVWSLLKRKAPWVLLVFWPNSRRPNAVALHRGPSCEHNSLLKLAFWFANPKSDAPFFWNASTRRSSPKPQKSLESKKLN